MTSTPSTPSFLVVGESVADIVRTPGQPDVPHPGGSPANVAYGLARLGRRVALLTQLGADEVGGLITAHLRSAGVELLTDGQTGVRTPTAIVTLDPDGKAGYAFDIHWSLRPVEPPVPADHVHLGSIAAVLPPGAEAALGLVQRLRPGASVSYDPNVRPALFGAPDGAPARVERCVALSDLVKASDEDVAWLYPGWSEQRVAEHWLGLGPGLVLITRGGAGAAAFTRYGTAQEPAVPAAVVDTVGAGDSFMAAVLDALATCGLLGAGARPALAALAPDVLAELLRHAGRAAAITVSRAGANPPTGAELRFS
ncbi:fructokinase [Kitasatospora gansuensis]|uniref:Fructokinase n=1 Tax=Kitasatospora gansuensis TaxID=258050 RepID=A0A7W7SDT3_9ACTN|nr:carbohydrate kinase [Kitasatospora gansuensis]MBB4948624.1 fructokinase [Kitasatospora gansuensis]